MLFNIYNFVFIQTQYHLKKYTFMFPHFPPFNIPIPLYKISILHSEFPTEWGVYPVLQNVKEPVQCIILVSSVKLYQFCHKKHEISLNEDDHDDPDDLVFYGLDYPYGPRTTAPQEDYDSRCSFLQKTNICKQVGSLTTKIEHVVLAIKVKFQRSDPTLVQDRFPSQTALEVRQ